MKCEEREITVVNVDSTLNPRVTPLCIMLRTAVRKAASPHICRLSLQETTTPSNMEGAGCALGLLIHVCPPQVFDCGQLGSLELLRAFVETAKGGRGPRKTQTLWPSFLFANSQSSLLRHTFMSPILCYHLQYEFHLAIHFSQHAQDFTSLHSSLPFSQKHAEA